MKKHILNICLLMHVRALTHDDGEDCAEYAALSYFNSLKHHFSLIQSFHRKSLKPQIYNFFRQIVILYDNYNFTNFITMAEKHDTLCFKQFLFILFLLFKVEFDTSAQKIKNTHENILMKSEFTH